MPLKLQKHKIAQIIFSSFKHSLQSSKALTPVYNNYTKHFTGL